MSETELDRMCDLVDCEGITAGYRMQDGEGNEMHCIETDAPLEDWCIPCLLRKQHEVTMDRVLVGVLQVSRDACPFCGKRLPAPDANPLHKDAPDA